MGDKNYYCKIDGTLYNLKKIQDIIDENPEDMGGVKIDLALYNEYHLTDPTVFCLSKIIEKTGEIPTEYNTPVLPKEYMSPFPQRLQCPRCGNINIAHYSRNVYNYKCRSCKHTWSQCSKCGGTEITCYMSYEPDGGYSLYYKTCSKCKHMWIE